jgi:small conductance mechanosensitive channel
VEDDDPTTMSEREKRADTWGRWSSGARAWSSAFPRSWALQELVSTSVLSSRSGIIASPSAQGANLVQTSSRHILFENQLRVGMWSGGGKTGTVKAVSLRTTILRDGEGCVHIIPNGTIDTVTNMSGSGRGRFST